MINQRFEEILLADYSKRHNEHLSQVIGKNPDLVSKLLSCLTSKDEDVITRSAWALSAVTDNHFKLLEPFEHKIAEIFANSKNNAVLRNTGRTLSQIQLSENSMEVVINKAFQLVEEFETPIAVRVHAITILCNMSGVYPEIIPEIKIHLSKMLDGSAGEKSRAKKLLKKLS
jgi:sulfite reductase alpha subunit-like flavoprotein